MHQELFKAWDARSNLMGSLISQKSGKRNQPTSASHFCSINFLECEQYAGTPHTK
jgi:hypothetical protein